MASSESKRLEVLRASGLMIVPGGFADIARITSRDTFCGSYPYNAGFSEMDMKRQNQIVVYRGVEMGFYFYGVKNVGDETVGKLGMIHVAPAARDRGLGSVMLLLSCFELSELNPARLSCMVGDVTGKVDGLLARLGFVSTGVAAMGQPSYECYLRERPELVDVWREMYETRARRLPLLLSSLSVETVDVDNPRRRQVMEVIEERLIADEDWFSSGEKVIYGYSGAEALIYLQNFTDGRSRLLLRLKRGNETENEIEQFGGLIADWVEFPRGYYEGASRVFCGWEAFNVLVLEVARRLDEVYGVRRALAAS